MVWFGLILFVGDIFLANCYGVQTDYEPNDRFAGVSATRTHNAMRECKVGREQEESFYGSFG